MRVGTQAAPYGAHALYLGSGIALRVPGMTDRFPIAGGLRLPVLGPICHLPVVWVANVMWTNPA
jgi:hypothetical protein